VAADTGLRLELPDALRLSAYEFSALRRPDKTSRRIRHKLQLADCRAKAFLHMALEECAVVGGNESR
ncbi:hypothetical protein LVK61_15185, partial [Escherichia coli]|nr:hypothetical protein [Escherichia coli]